MKERPILFSGSMVKAILERRKWQTRRIIKPQPEQTIEDQPYWHIGGFRLRENAYNHLACKYGVIGDRLWIRETWAYGWLDDREYVESIKSGEGAPIFYRADWPNANIQPSIDGRWLHAIHMPRFASRITLEITDVQVKRLNEITKWEAKAEGCPECKTCVDRCGQWGRGAIDDPLSLACGGRPWQDCHGICESKTEIEWFKDLWESLNGKGSWILNPWVWVLRFQRIDPVT